MPEVKLTHPDKVLFPDDGITKADLADHYARVADVMLPHVADRPLSLQVFPGGIGKKGHFLKQIPDYFPDWIERAELPKHGGTVTHMVADERGLAAHARPAQRDHPARPDGARSTSPTGPTG